MMNMKGLDQTDAAQTDLDNLWSHMPEDLYTHHKAQFKYCPQDKCLSNEPLTLSTLGKIFSRHLDIFSYFSQEIGIDISCKLSPDVKTYFLEKIRKKCHHIKRTNLYNFDPLKPHFYIVKLGFTGVYIIFLILPKIHKLWVLVRTASSRRF